MLRRAVLQCNANIHTPSTVRTYRRHAAVFRWTADAHASLCQHVHVSMLTVAMARGLMAPMGYLVDAQPGPAAAMGRVPADSAFLACS